MPLMEDAGENEVTILNKSFNRMAAKLQRLMEKCGGGHPHPGSSWSCGCFRNRSIPHFLYNTLETISSMAAVKQVFDICDICQRLGEIFRYNLGKNYGEFVTVAQELGHVQNYIFIIKKAVRKPF